jgi:hypothetical protein
MSEPYFDEEASIALLLRWRDFDDLRALDTLLEEHFEPLARRLIYTRQSQRFEDVDELTAACLRRLASRLSRFDLARGKLYSWCTKICEHSIVDVIRKKRMHADRLCPLDDVLANTLCTNGEVTSCECMDDIMHRLSGIQTVFTETREIAAQRWLLANLIMDGFCYRRWQAGDALSLVFALPPRRSRQIYDATVLEARRVLLGERKIPSTLGYNLSGTRGLALMKFKSQLSPQDFSRLCFIMRNLAPQALIGSGLYSLTEILNGSLRARPLFGPTESLNFNMSETAPFQFQLESVEEKARSARELEVQFAMPAAVVALSPRSVTIEEKPIPAGLVSHTAASLLQTETPSDFVRNLRELERSSKRSFSIAKALRETLTSGHPTGMELEVSNELKLLSGRNGGDPNAFMIPAEALSQRADLDSSSSSQLVPVRIEPSILPYLRNRTICGRLGATIIDNLSPGNHRLPRMSGTANANWQPETGAVVATNPTFDNDVILAPSRLESQVLVTRQLVRQSSPDIEKYIVADISAAIGVSVDAAALAGSGVSPIPTGILALPVNPAATYLYNARCPNVTWGGPASWSKVLAHELELETARVSDDGTLAWALSPDSRDKWAQTPQLTGFPKYLLENGMVNNRRAVSTFNLPPGTAILGKWSDIIIGSWSGIEVLLNEFSYASSSRILVRVSALMAINFKYSVSFVTSSDSAAQ